MTKRKKGPAFSFIKKLMQENTGPKQTLYGILILVGLTRAFQLDKENRDDLRAAATKKYVNAFLKIKDPNFMPQWSKFKRRRDGKIPHSDDLHGQTKPQM